MSDISENEQNKTKHKKSTKLMKIYFYCGIQIPWTNSELSFKQFHTHSQYIIKCYVKSNADGNEAELISATSIHERARNSVVSQKHAQHITKHTHTHMI